MQVHRADRLALFTHRQDDPGHLTLRLDDEAPAAPRQHAPYPLGQAGGERFTEALIDPVKGRNASALWALNQEIETI